MALSSLSAFIGEQAVEAASTYIERKGIKYDPITLYSRIRENLLESIDEMFTSAKDAIEHQMIKEAQAIVALSAKECGIKAAKSFEEVA